MSINDLRARLQNGDGFRNFQELLDFSYARTPCEEFPEECQPRVINHVVWDADDTLWDIKPFGIASMCHKPFRKLSDEAVEMQCERLVESSKDPTGKEKWKRVDMPGTVEMIPGVTETIERLKERGIGSSVASSNMPNTVESILAAMGRADDFNVIKSSWRPKSEMVLEIAKKLEVNPEEILFVDDDPINCSEIYEDLGSLAVCLGQDIKKPEEIFNYIL